MVVVAREENIIIHNSQIENYPDTKEDPLAISVLGIYTKLILEFMILRLLTKLSTDTNLLR